MPNIHVKRLQAAEFLEQASPIMGYAWRNTPPIPETSERDREVGVAAMHDTTGFILFDDGHPMTCASSTPMWQNLRGKVLGMSAVAHVASLPHARRKGHAFRTLRDLLTASHETDLALSVLYPFKESFYQRMGYVTMPHAKRVTLEPNALLPLLKRDLGGQVRWQSLVEGYDTYRAYVRRLVDGRHGMAASKEGFPLLRNKLKGDQWVAFAYADGQDAPSGAMLYRCEGTHGPLQVTRFFYDDSRAKYLLLSWIARHAEQSTEARLYLAPDERPETWMEDVRCKAERVGAPMCRVVDVRALNGLRVGPGRFTARIQDPHCPWNEGDWLFEAHAGVLHVAPCQEPSCTLTIQALSGLVYGSHEPADFAYRGWGDPSAETAQAMGQMFPSAWPFVNETF